MFWFLTDLNKRKHATSWDQLVSVEYNPAILIAPFLVFNVSFDCFLLMFLYCDRFPRCPRILKQDGLIDNAGIIWMVSYTLALITWFTLWVLEWGMYVPVSSATVCEFDCGFNNEQIMNFESMMEKYRIVGILLIAENWMIMCLLLTLGNLYKMDISLGRSQKVLLLSITILYYASLI